MKILPVLVSAAVLTVSLFGGTLAYQAASDPGGTAAAGTPSAATPSAQRGHRPRIQVRWAPCKPPAVREGRVCVTEEVRTVVVPAPAATAPAPARAPAVPAAHASAPDDRGGERAEHQDDDGEHEPEHESEHESEED